MEYTAFNHAAWNSLHSIRIHCATMQGIHCVIFKSIAPHCMESTAFSRDPFCHAASNPLHSMTLHGSHSINRDAFYHAAWNPLQSIGIHCATLQGNHCI